VTTPTKKGAIPLAALIGGKGFDRNHEKLAGEKRSDPALRQALAREIREAAALREQNLTRERNTVLEAERERRKQGTATRKKNYAALETEARRLYAAVKDDPQHATWAARAEAIYPAIKDFAARNNFAIPTERTVYGWRPK